MPETILTNCKPEPLMNYLKALGVFRLVAEQRDSNVRLGWKDGVAYLSSELDREAILQFFLNDYKPTPILAPWNGGSGFYSGSTEPLENIEHSQVPRLQLYRETITKIKQFVPESKPKDEEKETLLTRSRAQLSDEVVVWLDVCFVLGEEKLHFFPMLGSGGNDGRLEFTSNFMQRLADVIAFTNHDPIPLTSESLLRAALFDEGVVQLGNTAIGQFDPGGIGGVNGTQGSFEADSRVNPWDYVLMIEGTLLFAGSVARRLGANARGKAVFPFSVSSIAAGYGSASASEETSEGSRAEVWLPLWNRGAKLYEIQQLFAEGKAQLGRQQAKDAIEFALTVNLLGVSRGIQSFVRYGFLKRNGLAFLAAPLGRIEVTYRPNARLLQDPNLLHWLDQLRRACSDKDKTPARYQMVLRQIDRAIFAFANRSEQGNDGVYLLNVLTELGRAERVLANGLRFCEDKYIRPLQNLSTEWLEQADDESPEFGLAAALASLPLRRFIEPVQGDQYYVWEPNSTSAVWSNQPLDSNLSAVFRRRQMERFAKSANPKFKVAEPSDEVLRFPNRYLAKLSHVLAYLNGGIDEDKLTALIWALHAVEYPKDRFQANDHADQELEIPFEFGVPRLVVDSLPLRAKGKDWKFHKQADNPIVADSDVFHQFDSGRNDAIAVGLTNAARRLKSSGKLVVGYRNRVQSGKPIPFCSIIPPVRLLGAMLFPLSQSDLELIANTVLYSPESED